MTTSTAERPDLAALHNERSVDVRNAVAGLDSSYRQPLLLAFFEGLTHREIADRLDEPLGTVKSRVRAAIQTLKAKLHRYGGHDDELP
ncbi:ECF RNA polymerase sigma factor RpoE [Planctomycetes bacterium MalM25]|nr:ECF RNA polymerase sigma factor RpoE [Planctomycetes bacterium MalM25]